MQLLQTILTPTKFASGESHCMLLKQNRCETQFLKRYARWPTRLSTKFISYSMYQHICDWRHIFWTK